MYILYKRSKQSGTSKQWIDPWSIKWVERKLK
jgi:hypothetical protein